MLTKEQESELNKIRRRFIRIHGEKKWRKLKTYLGVPNASERDIASILRFDRTTARYWIVEVREVIDQLHI